MADNIFSDPGATALYGAVATAGLAWLGNRLVGKAAIQTAVNQAFEFSMNQMRQELRAALRERDKTEAENTELRVRVEELRATIAAMRAGGAS